VKGPILRLLRKEPQHVPVDKIASKLRTSADSVWAHIHELEAAGYGLSITADTLRLDNSPDALFPWEFPGRESRIHYHQELSSTMDEAKALAFAGCPDFTTVLAERQTSGRGRLQRVWQSARGGLYFTLVLRPNFPPRLSFRVNFAASVVLAKVLQGMFDIDARVKWPNDILVGERKLSGMLSELETDGEAIAFVNLGIGINVNNDPEIVEPNAISMKELLGKPTSRQALLARFLDDFEDRLHHHPLDDIITEWKEYTLTLNRQVKIVTINGQFEGFARDVDESGALVLELADGSLKKVIYGDCFH
jgi:BirA family biotin operon repressor/biotin-[acetyl-CoA-carboxylase] ligase